jgi:hypothetical protein
MTNYIVCPFLTKAVLIHMCRPERLHRVTPSRAVATDSDT